MLSRLRKLLCRTLNRREPAAPVPLPPGLVVYAVGDVHGRGDLLEPLLAHVLQDGAPELHVVMLGDYVDRGPRSDAVLEAMIRLRKRLGDRAHFLMGNHDCSMLWFLVDAAAGPAWCEHGGRSTLAAYGVEAPWSAADTDGWEIARKALLASTPRRQLTLLHALEPSFTLGGYFFSHAGARPGTPLDQQDHKDLLWIRNAFLNDPRPFSHVVVHGHSPAEAPHSDHRRIGVDTGAYATGVLTAVRLEGSDRRFVEARSAQGSGEVRVTERGSAAAQPVGAAIPAEAETPSTPSMK